MTARTEGDLLRSLRRVDGWFTVGLVVLVCATLAWSLDDALLVLGRDEYTDFLFWAAIGGVTAGLVGPLVGWGRWKTHVIGAVFAALLVPLLVGWTLIPTGAPPGELFQRTTDSVVLAWSDLALAGRMSTIQFGHHLFALGILTWATSQFASYAAFGHRRPINAVVVVGSLLLANMALTVRDQLTYLVIFSIASLFLLVRFHTLDEQSDWLRRRIGDPDRDLCALPARRHGLHHRRDQRLAPAHERGLVGTARRGLDRCRRTGHRVGPVPRAVPAGVPVEPLARADLRRQHPRRADLEHDRPAAAARRVPA